MFVDLLISKHNHNCAAVQRFLLVLGAPGDACQLRGAVGVCWPSRKLSDAAKMFSLSFSVGNDITSATRKASVRGIWNTSVQGVTFWNLYIHGNVLILGCEISSEC